MIALSSQPPSLLRLLPIAATARLSAIRNHLIVNDYPCNLRDSRNFQIGAQPDREDYRALGFALGFSFD